MREKPNLKLKTEVVYVRWIQKGVKYEVKGAAGRNSEHPDRK